MKVKYVGVVSLLVSLLWLGLSWLPIGAQTAAQPDASAAVTWLLSTHQNEDGGFSSFSAGADLAPSDVGGTLDVLLALASVADEEVASTTAVPREYLRDHASELADYAALDGSTAGKTLLALSLAGENPRDFNGHDFVIQLTDYLSPTGELGVTTAYGQALGLLGLAVANEPVPETAVAWLINQQAADGSWDDGFGTASNPDATAMALSALIAVGEGETASVANAVAFLTAAQLESGGWEYGTGFGENVNSTALAIQALRTAGATDGIAQGMAALASWQADTGAFQADFGNGRFDDFFSTLQAIPAAAGFSYAPAESGNEVTVSIPVVVVEGGEDADPTAVPDPSPVSADEESSTNLWLPILLVVVLLVAVAAIIVWRRRQVA